MSLAHSLFRQELPHLHPPAGPRRLARLGPGAWELPGYGGPGEVHPSDQAALTLGDCTLAVVGLGGIGAETARRGLAFGMRVLGVDPGPRRRPESASIGPSAWTKCWARATSWSSPPRIRPKHTSCLTVPASAI